jgi:hypothetical protein
MAKTLEEILLSVLDSSEVDNLVFGEEDSQLAVELYESVQACLNFISANQKIDEGLPEADISNELESTFNILLEQQNSTKGYQIDPVAIAFFKLGQSVGRQQVLMRNILPLKKVIEDRLIKQKQGELAKRKKLGIDYVATVLLDHLVVNSPSEFLNNGVILSQFSRGKIKNQLQDHFLKGSSNYKVVGSVIVGETGSATRLSNALKRKLNEEIIDWPEDIISQLEIKSS